MDDVILAHKSTNGKNQENIEHCRREEHCSKMEDKNILQSGDRMHQPENLANLISTQFGAKVHLH